jgi:hypothetical protein
MELEVDVAVTVTVGAVAVTVIVGGHESGVVVRGYIPPRLVLLTRRVLSKR